jgi:hypothetical protein
MALPNLTTLYPGSGTPTDYCNAIPQFPLVWNSGHDLDLTVFEDDATQARKISDVKHREVKLIYACQSDAEKASFEAFFDARFGLINGVNGLATPVFYFNDTRTGENNIMVRFRESKVSYSADGPRTWSWAVTIFQVTS